LAHAVQVQRCSPSPYPRSRYRVCNWPAYEAGLKRRGDLTLWIDESALDGWQAPRRTTPGGQAIYSDLAIEMVLVLRLVFHLALRQAEAFAGSVFRLLGLDLCVPDHTTLSRRGGDFARRRPNVTSHGARHLIVDSTGLKLFGQGEWNEERHGRSRRSWRKLHLAVDAGTGEIVANALTDNGADDVGEVPVCSSKSKERLPVSSRMVRMMAIRSTKLWHINSTTRRLTW
jgi:hypothetical protein